MDAKRLDLEAIKQDWQESRWSFASRGGWAENYALALFEALEAAWVDVERLRELLDDANANYEHCVGTNTRLQKRVEAFKELAQEHHTTEGVMRLVAMGSDDNCPICRDHWPQEAPNSSG